MSKGDKEPEPPAVVEFKGEGGKVREVPLVDVTSILTQHKKVYPLELPDGLGALEFHVISERDRNRIKTEHQNWLLRGGGLDEAVEFQRLLEKVKAGDMSALTDEERTRYDLFETKSWPYNTELTHAMLHRPEMNLDRWRDFVRALPPGYWEIILFHCIKVLKSHYKVDPKNL